LLNISSAGRLGGRPKVAVKVAFDSRPLKDHPGTRRYARCLLEALHGSGRAELIETHDPRRCDVFHAPWMDGAMVRCPVPMVVTVHDLVSLKRPGERLRAGLRSKLSHLAVQRATRVIVPTNSVADDVIKVLDVPSDRVVAIPEAAAPRLRPRSEEEITEVRRRFGLPDNYLLWVGGLRAPDPRKRVAALARTRRTMPLVLVGAAGEWAHRLPDVILTGEVTDDNELAAIYSGAHALVYPSEDAGFGLPAVEALACGTPVAACDVPALREVLGGHATLRSVEDLDGLVAAAESAKRPAPAPPSWTWEDAAAATWQVYAEAAAEPDAWRSPHRRHAARLTGSARAA
jgi:glycosyltransferase involved in cell wall biosynthesis